MKIFLAGATGVIGRRLVPLLVDRGHEVVGTTRSADKAEALRVAGAEPVLLDVQDLVALGAAVAQAEPEAVIHQLTALTGSMDIRNLDRSFATTNALRTAGTDQLLAAAVKVGARRFIAQSFTGWTNPRSGGPVKSENDPLDPTPEPRARQTLAAIAHLERTVTEATGIDGLALRYGLFYGPGTGMAAGGQLLELVANRKLPIVGGGTGIWSWVHVDDAATATVAAVERGAPGVYNIVDDDPAPVSEWLPYLADAIGAMPPRKVPAWLVRPLLGAPGISAMTKIRGSSNA
ncbi:MAG: NAD-dependent epimerase/dehydratase family protein, partial [Nitriliruptorales bacterium]|nr:NAD-dependent epimerase/dehydratase family protein [Nitriliruptorales bacterium]